MKKFYICLVVLFFTLTLGSCITVGVTAPGEPDTTNTSVPLTVPTVVIQPTQAESVPTEPTVPTVPPTTMPLLIDCPMLFTELVYNEASTTEAIDTFVADVDLAVAALLEECTSADKYTVEAISAMLEEIDRLTAAQTLALKQKDVLIKWAEKEKKYYYATATWKYLKDLGYSDVACAGILGNLMAETGGGSLKLNPFLYDKATGKYYGLFQWAEQYYSEIHGKGFEEQLEFFKNTVDYEFKTFGWLYYDGFTLDAFNQLESSRDAALAFAKVYERCASWTYERRQNYAEIAYEYFVLDFVE